MSEPKDQQERSRLQHEAEHAKPRKKASVMSYLAILFAAAFLLLLLSYFMQQRTSEQTISGLQDSVTGLQSSVSAMQSVENLIEDNKLLHEKVDVLESELEDLTKKNTSLESDRRTQADRNAQLQDQLIAMDWLWRIQRAYSRGSRDDCRTMVDQFEATGLPPALPNTVLAGVVGPTPAEQYAALLDALDYHPEP